MWQLSTKLGYLWLWTITIWTSSSSIVTTTTTTTTTSLMVVEGAAVVSSSSSSSSSSLSCKTTPSACPSSPSSDSCKTTTIDIDHQDDITTTPKCGARWKSSIDSDTFSLMRGGGSGSGSSRGKDNTSTSTSSSSRTRSRSRSSTSETTTTTTTTPPKSSAMLEGFKNSLASALAAGVSKAILAPFDTIKTMQQNYVATAAGAAATTSSSSLGFWKAATMIMERPQGFLELYAGLGVAVVGSMPSVGLYFGVYSYCKRTLEPTLTTWFSSHTNDTNGSTGGVSEGMIRTLTIASSAAIGNTVASFSRVPYEVVKQKLQTGMYSSTLEALTTMASQEGWRAFFPMGGVSIQMIRDIPYAMVTLLSYEYLRDTFIHTTTTTPTKTAGTTTTTTTPSSMSNNSPPQDTTTKTTTVWKDMIVGATAGGIGSYVTNPMDVIKTRLQTDPELYQGQIGTCFAMTLEEGGPMAFLRGSIPRLLHKIPANGCFFVFYEFFRRVLQVEEDPPK